MNINELLLFSCQQAASDLHLVCNLPPLLRINGDLQQTNFSVLSPTQLATALYDIMCESERKQLTQYSQVDFCYSITDFGRFRVNVFQQQHGLSAVMRIIPQEIPSLTDLHLPESILSLLDFANGLVLITGPTGSGKSTSLAALLDHINATQHKHIITIEDPIEFIYQNKKSVINQRQVHRDTISFTAALRAALRQDPDIILIGELRDLETMQLALTAAETGHLVLATLHTNSAAKTMHRIIDVFPGNEKAIARTLLADTLQTIIAQRLIQKKQGGRIAAYEILRATPAIRNLIREDKISQIYSMMQTGQQFGMQTLEQHLSQLKQQGLI